MKKAVDQQIEQALQALNLPSRSQLTAVAKQIVELEERIERLEDIDHRQLLPAPRSEERAMIGKTITELAPGDRAEIVRAVEEDDIASFVDAVGDYNPVHSDPDYAADDARSRSRSRRASSRRG